MYEFYPDESYLKIRRGLIFRRRGRRSGARAIGAAFRQVYKLSNPSRKTAELAEEDPS